MAVELERTREFNIQCEDWGLLDYQQASDRQLIYVDEVASGQRSETIVFCSHPPVVTLGRGTKEGDITSWSGETITVSRGGRATYHGPSQLVIYPIINLANENRTSVPAKDIHAYLRLLEQALIHALSELGIHAEARNAEGSEYTGVWVGDKKLISIGVAVRKWVTYHGAAINCVNDPQAFSGIRPCGFTKETMLSLETLLGTKYDREKLISLFSHHLLLKLR